MNLIRSLAVDQSDQLSRLTCIAKLAASIQVPKLGNARGAAVTLASGQKESWYRRTAPSLVFLESWTGLNSHCPVSQLPLDLVGGRGLVPQGDHLSAGLSLG